MADSKLLKGKSKGSGFEFEITENSAEITEFELAGPSVCICSN